MLTVNFFYCTLWISCLSVFWFYTDWFAHYSQLLNVAEETRIKYMLYIEKYPDKYFPEFLYDLSFYTDNRLTKFLFKLISCPFCLIFWLCVLFSALFCSLVDIAPMYVLSLFTVLQIKRLF